MFCGKCGKQIDDQASFCPECGEPVAHAIKPPRRTPANTQNGIPAQPTTPKTTASDNGFAQPTTPSCTPAQPSRSGGAPAQAAVSSSVPAQSAKSSKRRVAAIVAIAAVVLVAIVAALVVLHPWATKGTLTAGASDAETYQTLRAYVDSLQEGMIDADGTVTAEQAGELVDQFYEAADAATQQGQFKTCNADDRCVYLELNSGIGFVYTPHVAGDSSETSDATSGSTSASAGASSSTGGASAGSGNASTSAAIAAGNNGAGGSNADASSTASLAVYRFEPFFDTRGSSSAASVVNGYVDETAQSIANSTKNALSASADIDRHNAAVSLKSIAQMGDHSVILWYGSGQSVPVEAGADPVPVLFTGDTVSATDILSQSDGSAAGVVVDQDGRIGVTPSYFANNLADGALDGSIVYLGADCSGQGSALAGAFIAKGAAAVFGYSDRVQPGYAANMLKLLFEKMAAQDAGVYPSASAALGYAKDTVATCANTDGTGTWGATDAFDAYSTELVLFGNGDYTLDDLWMSRVKAVYNAALDAAAANNPAYSQDATDYSTKFKSEYALADLTGDGIPELLLATYAGGATNCSFYTVIGGALSTIDGTAQTGVWPTGGFRGSLQTAADGNGIYDFEWIGGTGQCFVSRLTVRDGTLVRTDLPQYSFKMFTDEETAFTTENPALSWYEITDRSPLS